MFILKFPNGKITPFYVESCANVFKSCFGGEIYFDPNYNKKGI